MSINALSAVKRTYTINPLAPDLIPRLRTPGTAQILWIGCSDSLIVETEALDVDAEEMFVHRNLGHVISNGDLSSRSALEYCLDVLKVAHVVVCGHYGCGLVRDDRGPEADHGWHRDLSNLHEANEAYFSEKCEVVSEDARNRHLEEVWVLAEVDWLRNQDGVKEAMQSRGLQVHGFVYDKTSKTSVRLLETERAA